MSFFRPDLDQASEYVHLMLRGSGSNEASVQQAGEFRHSFRTL